MPCTYCDANSGGGVSTNFDPYGTRRKLGLPVEEVQFICWPCWEKEGAGKDARIQEETDGAVVERGGCGFLEAWIGHCFNDRPCSKHQNKACWECGAPATKNCAVAGSLVCGTPECSDHPHPHRGSL